GRDQAGERQAEPERDVVAGREDRGRVTADQRERSLADVDPADGEGDPDAEADEAQDRGVGQDPEDVGGIGEPDRQDHQIDEAEKPETGEAQRGEAELPEGQVWDGYGLTHRPLNPTA